MGSRTNKVSLGQTNISPGEDGSVELLRAGEDTYI